jgi:hypothetical protein
MRLERKYGLFERQDGKWVQLYTSLVGPLEWARRVFQSALLDSALGYVTNERRLRPVKEKLNNFDSRTLN